MSRSRAPSFTASASGNDPPSRRASVSRASFGSNRIRMKPLTPLDKGPITSHFGSPVQSPIDLPDHYSHGGYIPTKSPSAMSHSERSIPNRSQSFSNRYPRDPVVDLPSSSHLGSVHQSSLPHYSLGQRDDSHTASQQQSRQGRSRAPSFSVGKIEESGQTYVRRASSTQRSFVSQFSEAFEDSTDAEEYAKKRHGRRVSTYARDPTAVSVAASPSTPNAQLPDSTEMAYEVETDAETFVLTTGIIFGRLPLDKAQSDKPLGRLWDIVKNWKDLLGQFKNKFSAIQFNASESTEFAILWHDLTTQLDHFTRCLCNEEEISNYISAKSEFIKRKLNVSDANALYGQNNESSSLSLTRVASNPAYAALLLDLLHCVARLTLILLPHFEGFLTSLLNDTEGDKENANFSKLYDAIRGSLEQLTGDTVQPLIQSIIDWYEISQDVILDFADEVQEFMSSPVSMPEVDDFVRHPLTGKPYSPSETQSRVQAITERARIMILEEPHRSALIRALKAFSRVIDGIHGNSEWVRWIRCINRLWASWGREETTVEDWADAVRIISQKCIQLPFNDIETGDESSTCKLSNIAINCQNIVPEQVSFKKESTVSFGRSRSSDESPCVQQYILQLSNISIDANNVAFAYAKEKGVGLSDEGSVNVAMKVNVNIIFARENSAQKLTWPRYVSSSIKIIGFKLQFDSTVKNALYQHILLPFIQKSIVESIESKSNAWFSEQLAFWFPRQGILPAKTTAKRRRYVAPSTRVNVKPSQTTLPAFPPSAREAFRQNVRTVPDLHSDVLDKLENPFSNASSTAPSEVGDDNKEPRKAHTRRKSMAEYLTLESSKDATLEENITAPPTAVSAPGNIPDEMAYAYDNMAASLSDLNRRDTTTMEAIKAPPVHPSNFLSSNRPGETATGARSRINSFGEMSYDQYEQAIADDEDDITKGAAMARSLSEFTSRDATTLAAIKSPLVAPSSGATYNEGDYTGNARPSRPSMSKVTCDLSGIKNSSLTEPTSATSIYDGSTVPYQPRPRAMSVHSSYSQPVAGIASRRTSMTMADTLDSAASRDYTTPEGQEQFYRRASQASQSSAATGLSRDELLARKRSFALNEEASRDATLIENRTRGSIPPSMSGSPLLGTTPLSSSRRMSVVSSASVPRSPYTGLSPNQILPMGATLSEDAEVDQTTPEGQAELHRRKPSSGEQGFDREHVRRKSMSSYLSEAAMVDTTVYDGIATPPSADPEMLDERDENKPHPLQRRPSTVIH